MTSKADNIGPSPRRAAVSSATTSSYRASPQSAAQVQPGLGNRRRTARVIMPSVPSDPMKSCFRS